MSLGERKVGESCTNGPWQETYTCPNCYTDHSTKVAKCENCGVPLRCEKEQQWVAKCTIIEETEE